MKLLDDDDYVFRSDRFWEEHSVRVGSRNFRPQWRGHPIELLVKDLKTPIKWSCWTTAAVLHLVSPPIVAEDEL